MESFVHDYITSTYDDELNEGLLERRLSPYATLRPGDLAALLRFQVHLPALVNNRFSCCNENDSFGCKTRSSHEIDHILECQASDTREEDYCGGTNDARHVDNVVCRGADTNNSPVEYTVKGLHHHEMPVVGVCVDARICPGFQYLVRRAGSDRYFFNHVPKTLLSIGMGYGKRLTFAGDSLNNNECYFWSDSEPDGYAFSIHVVDVGQRFSILDADNVIVGEAVVDNVSEPHEELSTLVNGKTITKRVKIIMTCCMKYYQRHNHGLVEMMVHEDLELVSGEAVLTKTRLNKTAYLSSIEQVFLQRFGICKLEPDA